MTGIDFLAAVGKTDMKYVEECLTYERPKTATVIIKRAALIAACVAVAAAGIFIFNKRFENNGVTNVKETVITDENGFYVENGVLLSYSGSENEVVIPENVETIADYAFMENPNREAISVVRLGKSVSKVENNAFAGLDKLITLSVDEENPAFVNVDGLIMSPDMTILYHCEREKMETFTVPDSVRVIASGALREKGLSEVDFGNSVEILAYNCFGSNDKLKAIDLPDSVKLIESYAFSGCISAVDGNIPKRAAVQENAFYGVPFYYTLLAGEMCPGEEIARGLVTPSEAVLKSDLDALTRQINNVLVYLKKLAAGSESEPIDPSESVGEEASAYYVSSGIKRIPENAVIPEIFTLDELGFSDSGWGKTGIYDLMITLPCGDQLLVMEAYGYALFYETYWKDSVFRLTKAYFVPKTTPQADEDSFGWSAEMYKEDRMYTGMTLMNEDGRIINCGFLEPSETPYKLTFSPDGTKVAVEYTRRLYTSIYIQTLNGEKLRNGLYDYVLYMGNYYGRYEKGTLVWKDNETIEGTNEYGRFEWNINENGVTVIKEKDPSEEPDMVYKAHELLMTDALFLRNKYGEFSCEYEDGDLTVFSVGNVQGLLFGFFVVEEPFVPDDRTWPSEVVIDENYPDPVYGLRVGERIEDKEEYYWDHALYDDYPGQVTLIKDFGDYSIFVTVLTKEADDFDSFIRQPSGEITKIYFQIRIS